MPHAISNFRLSDTLECGAALRMMKNDAHCMEDVARSVVRFLYDDIVVTPGGPRAFGLVRLFKTQPAAKLEPALRSYAEARAAERVNEETACLCLLASAGDEPQWNSRVSSASHRAIPLTSEAMIREAPMIHRLLSDLGVPLRAVVGHGADLLVDVQHQSFRVFHVEQALGSPSIPAQKEFVIPHSIESVLGFGGILAGGSFFAVLLFAHTRIERPIAELFGSLALNVKIALQSFRDDEVFATNE